MTYCRQVNPSPHTHPKCIKWVVGCPRHRHFPPYVSSEFSITVSEVQGFCKVTVPVLPPVFPWACPANVQAPWTILELHAGLPLQCSAVLSPRSSSLLRPTCPRFDSIGTVAPMLIRGQYFGVLAQCWPHSASTPQDIGFGLQVEKPSGLPDQ